MYSGSVLSKDRSGLGPWRLARGMAPRPLATYRRWSAGLKRTEVGYMPVGIKPRGFALPGSLTLKSATLLASALATNRSWPSGVRLKLLGVLPAGALGNNEQEIVSRFLPSATLITLTLVELAQATNSVLPSGDNAISVGCFSV